MRKRSVKGTVLAAVLALSLSGAPLSPAMAAEESGGGSGVTAETEQDVSAMVIALPETAKDGQTKTTPAAAYESPEEAAGATGEPGDALAEAAGETGEEAEPASETEGGQSAARALETESEKSAARALETESEKSVAWALETESKKSAAEALEIESEKSGAQTAETKSEASAAPAAEAASRDKESAGQAAEKAPATEGLSGQSKEEKVPGAAEALKENAEETPAGEASSGGEGDVVISEGETEEAPMGTLEATPAPEAQTLSTVPPIILAMPTLSSIKNVNAGIKVTWKKVEGAVVYRVYRKEAEDSAWKKLCDTKACTVTDETAVSGTNYSYTVGCLRVGTAYKASDYDSTGLTMCRLASPEPKANNAAGGVKVSWAAVDGALKYDVYRKDDAGAWQKLTRTKKLWYIDQTVTSGTRACYTVRAVGKDSNGRTVRSSYLSEGATRRYLAMPEVTLSVKGNQVTITWKKVPGATSYQILRRKRGKSWSKIAVVKNLSYTDTGLKAGRTWQYSVRCKEPVYSAYNTETKAITILPAPKMNNLLYADGVLNISWKKVEGATGYRVFRKAAGGKWKKVGDTTGLSMQDKTTPKDVKVYYRVKALCECGVGIPMNSSKNIKLLKWNSKWTYAKNAAIYSGTPVLYQAPGAVRKKIVVCINAGHGTKGGSSVKTLCHPDGSAKVTDGTAGAGATRAYAVSTGTDMRDGSSEASNTLKVALATRDILLKEGYDVVMIREGSDIQLDNIARTLFANRFADCHIAIHYDGTSSDKGAFFMSVPNVTSYRNMEPVKSHWKEHNALGTAVIAGLRSADVKIWSSGEMEMDLTQTSYSTVPSIDLEVGDEASPLTDAARKKLAAGILAGLNKYFKQ